MYRFTAILCLAFFVAACHGLDQCTSCDPGTEFVDCTLEKGGRDFDPAMTVDRNICKNIRLSDRQVQRLCDRHPNGYTLRCKAGEGDEFLCRHPHLCLTPKPEYQGARNGASHPTSSWCPSMVLLPVLLYTGLRAVLYS